MLLRGCRRRKALSTLLRLNHRQQSPPQYSAVTVHTIRLLWRLFVGKLHCRSVRKSWLTSFPGPGRVLHTRYGPATLGRSDAFVPGRRSILIPRSLGFRSDLSDSQTSPGPRAATPKAIDVLKRYRSPSLDPAKDNTPSVQFFGQHQTTNLGKHCPKIESFSYDVQSSLSIFCLLPTRRCLP